MDEKFVCAKAGWQAYNLIDALHTDIKKASAEKLKHSVVLEEISDLKEVIEDLQGCVDLSDTALMKNDLVDVLKRDVVVGDYSDAINILSRIEEELMFKFSR